MARPIRILKKIFSGANDDAKLTPKGLEQATRAGRELRDKGIEVIVASPLRRTQHTAKIIAEQIGYDEAKIVTTDLVAEPGFGFYESKPYSLLKEHQEKGRVEDIGETLEETHARIKKAFLWLAKRPEKVILVVSHGGVGRMFRVVDRELSHDDFHVVERFDNCEIDEFTI